MLPKSSRAGWGFQDRSPFKVCSRCRGFVGVLITGAALFVAFTAGAFGEELGWRGLLAPNLAGIMGYTKASLVGGAVWAAGEFGIGLAAAGVVCAVIFWRRANRRRGSLPRTL
jgi:membrane protease YdiL (CAAX protease family)